MARRTDPRFLPFAFDEPMPLPGCRERNGEYRGGAPVRHLPPGVTGTDLGRAARLRIAPGQVWHRGEQLVRIVRLSAETVTFRELTHGHATRHEPRARFLRMGFPERGFERAPRDHRKHDFDDED